MCVAVIVVQNSGYWNILNAKKPVSCHFFIILLLVTIVAVDVFLLKPHKHITWYAPGTLNVYTYCYTTVSKCNTSKTLKSSLRAGAILK